MNTINVEYTLTVKINGLQISPNESRNVTEAKIKELAMARIRGLVGNTMFDPEGKVFSESIKIVKID